MAPLPITTFYVYPTTPHPSAALTVTHALPTRCALTSTPTISRFTTADLALTRHGPIRRVLTSAAMVGLLFPSWFFNAHQPVAEPSSRSGLQNCHGREYCCWHNSTECNCNSDPLLSLGAIELFATITSSTVVPAPTGLTMVTTVVSTAVLSTVTSAPSATSSSTPLPRLLRIQHSLPVRKLASASVP